MEADIKVDIKWVLRASVQLNKLNSAISPRLQMPSFEQMASVTLPYIPA
jgi:hypothetical protein